MIAKSNHFHNAIKKQYLEDLEESKVQLVFTAVTDGRPFLKLSTIKKPVI